VEPRHPTRPRVHQQAELHAVHRGAQPDANPEQMNRYVWYQTNGWTKPYPGDSKIYAPNQVPGATLPSSDSE
jgi:hypothetical protein